MARKRKIPTESKPNEVVKVGTKNRKRRLLEQGKSLRSKMFDQLKSSRFRYINEEIYTMRGSEALKYFKSEPAAFTAYHNGYQKQLKQWPKDPLDRIISSINHLHGKSKDAVIADFGCGSARLAKTLTQYKVHSFDLVALDPCVTVCDIASTPLSSSSVDVVVCCLSLMGTNLGDYIKEANRILKIGGSLMIAEVASRFENVEEFVADLEKFGFKENSTDFSEKIFYYCTFIKERDLGKRAKKNVPVISLKACLYKKR